MPKSKRKSQDMIKNEILKIVYIYSRSCCVRIHLDTSSSFPVFRPALLHLLWGSTRQTPSLMLFLSELDMLSCLVVPAIFHSLFLYTVVHVLPSLSLGHVLFVCTCNVRCMIPIITKLCVGVRACALVCVLVYMCVRVSVDNLEREKEEGTTNSVSVNNF